jgi:uncharacterized membrane protein YbhN (UPF0104 family)
VPNLRSVLRSLAGTAVILGGVVAAGLAARDSLSSALHELGGGRRLPLVLAAACAPLVPGFTAASWRSVLASHGAPLAVGQAWWCYGAGSLANTFLPGRMGDALRIELFSRRLRHSRRRWLACGVAASIGLAQSVVFGLVLGLESFAGALPLWAAVPSLACPALMFAGGRLALVRHPDGRVACLAGASRLSPAAWTRLFACICASATARLLVIASVLDALAVPHPLSAAVIASGGLALGNSIPLAPGGAGVAAATMAVALGQTGLHASTAVAAAVAFHAFETGASLGFGIGGWLVLRLAPSTGGSVRRVAAEAALAASTP